MAQAPEKPMGAQDSVQSASVAAAARKEPFGGPAVALLAVTAIIAVAAIVAVIFI